MPTVAAIIVVGGAIAVLGPTKQGSLSSSRVFAGRVTAGEDVDRFGLSECGLGGGTDSTDLGVILRLHEIQALVENLDLLCRQGRAVVALVAVQALNLDIGIVGAVVGAVDEFGSSSHGGEAQVGAQDVQEMHCEEILV